MTTAKGANLLPLTPAAFHILRSLTKDDMHGYAIKREVEKRTAGGVRLGAGTLFHALQGLRDHGLVVEVNPVEACASNWRVYHISRDGRRALTLEVKRLETEMYFMLTPVLAA